MSFTSLFTTSPAFSPEEILRIVNGNNVTSVEKMLNQLAKQNNLDSLIKIKDSQNNTLLHIAVSNKKPDIEIVKSILNKLGHYATTLCKTMNNTGHTPLYLAELISDPTTKTTLINLLLPKTLDCSIKKLSTPINEEEVLNHSPETLKNSKLKENLQLACHAINLTRKETPDSSTHPQFNHFNLEKKFEMLRRITDLRKKLYASGPTLNLNDISATKDRAAIIKAAAIANCTEHSLLMLSHLREMIKETSTQVEIAYFANGDHAFNVIGREAKSDINKPSTWGANAVIADAWAGEAYPANEIESKLSDYISAAYNSDINASYNLLAFYNPAYHKIESNPTYQSLDPDGYWAFIKTPECLAKFLFSLRDKSSLATSLNDLGCKQINEILASDSDLYLFHDLLPVKNRWKADTVFNMPDIFGKTLLTNALRENNWTRATTLLTLMENCQRILPSDLATIKRHRKDLTSAFIELTKKMNPKEKEQHIQDVSGSNNALGVILNTHKTKLSHLFANIKRHGKTTHMERIDGELHRGLEYKEQTALKKLARN